MFSGLTDFAKVRTALGAVGFYLFYLLVTILVAALAGGLMGAIDPNAGFEGGARAGTVVAAAMSLVLSFLVLSRRGATGHPVYLLIALAGAIGALLLGGLAGTLAPAILSTRPARGPQATPPAVTS